MRKRSIPSKSLMHENACSSPTALVASSNLRTLILLRPNASKVSIFFTCVSERKFQETVYARENMLTYLTDCLYRKSFWKWGKCFSHLRMWALFVAWKDTRLPPHIIIGWNITAVLSVSYTSENSRVYSNHSHIYSNSAALHRRIHLIS